MSDHKAITLDIKPVGAQTSLEMFPELGSVFIRLTKLVEAVVSKDNVEMDKIAFEMSIQGLSMTFDYRFAFSNLIDEK